MPQQDGPLSRPPRSRPWGRRSPERRSCRPRSCAAAGTSMHRTGGTVQQASVAVAQQRRRDPGGRLVSRDQQATAFIGPYGGLRRRFARFRVDEDELGPHPIGEMSRRPGRVPGLRGVVDSAHDSHETTVERDACDARGVEAVSPGHGDRIPADHGSSARGPSAVGAVQARAEVGTPSQRVGHRPTLDSNAPRRAVRRSSRSARGRYPGSSAPSPTSWADGQAAKALRRDAQDDDVLLIVSGSPRPGWLARPGAGSLRPGRCPSWYRRPFGRLCESGRPFPQRPDASRPEHRLGGVVQFTTRHDGTLELSGWRAS